MDKVDVRSTFEALQPLDLKQYQTVGQLVRAMSKCSFVARQLGEVAATLLRWSQCARDGERVCVLLPTLGESFLATPFLHLLHRRFTPAHVVKDFRSYYNTDTKLLVLGRFGEEVDPITHQFTQAIFINREGLCAPGQVQDGYFPNVVFEDPRFVVPVISAALDEWLGIKTWTVTELFATLPQYGGLAAEVVQGAKVLKAMIDDPECTVFMTASGAMTIAQMDLLFCDMIDQKMINYLATTGALMAHGLIKSTGLRQFKHRPEHGDVLYGEQHINRVTDTLEPEENFSHIDEVMNVVLEEFDGHQPISPSELHWAIGAHLATHYPQERGILKSAYERGVPVCVPAFTDSELGNDVFCHNVRRLREGRRKLVMDLELDTNQLMDLAIRSKRMGIFSIGGGVPRNNTQNVAPLIEIYKDRLGCSDLPDRAFSYGCRICPDPLWHGHLSGCTYDENTSWRKFTPDAEKAEVHADATVTWPFILRWVMEQR